MVTEKPRRWDQARKLINEKNKNRRFRTPGEREALTGEAKIRANERIAKIKGRTRCAICKEQGHWAAECPKKGTKLDKNSPLYEKPSSMGSVDVETDTEAEQDATISVRQTWKHALIAMKEQFGDAFERDLISPCEVGYGAIDTACGYCMIGQSTLDNWIKAYALAGHTIKKERIHLVFNYGNGGKLKANTAVLLPIGLGGRNGLIRVAVVDGHAPLLLSRNTLIELDITIRPKRGLAYLDDGSSIRLSESRGEFLMLPLNHFANTGDAGLCGTLDSAKEIAVFAAYTNCQQGRRRRPRRQRQRNSSDSGEKTDRPRTAKIHEWLDDLRSQDSVTDYFRPKDSGHKDFSEDVEGAVCVSQCDGSMRGTTQSAVAPGNGPEENSSGFRGMSPASDTRSGQGAIRNRTVPFAPSFEHRPSGPDLSLAVEQRPCEHPISRLHARVQRSASRQLLRLLLTVQCLQVDAGVLSPIGNSSALGRQAYEGGRGDVHQAAVSHPGSEETGKTISGCGSIEVEALETITSGLPSDRGAAGWEDTDDTNSEAKRSCCVPASGDVQDRHADHGQSRGWQWIATLATQESSRPEADPDGPRGGGSAGRIRPECDVDVRQLDNARYGWDSEDAQADTSAAQGQIPRPDRGRAAEPGGRRLRGRAPQRRRCWVASAERCTIGDEDVGEPPGSDAGHGEALGSARSTPGGDLGGGGNSGATESNPGDIGTEPVKKDPWLEPGADPWKNWKGTASVSVERSGHRWKAPRPSVAVVKSRRSEKAFESKLIEMERRGVSTQELRKWIGKAKQAVHERVREREAVDCFMAASSLPPRAL